MNTNHKWKLKIQNGLFKPFKEKTEVRLLAMAAGEKNVKLYRDQLKPAFCLTSADFVTYCKINQCIDHIYQIIPNPTPSSILGEVLAIHLCNKCRFNGKIEKLKLIKLIVHCNTKKDKELSILWNASIDLIQRVPGCIHDIHFQPNE